ncbi:monovalent cation:proton antiporter-2 (CPA2) family protein [Iodobacter fluviatilis]|uniref:K(+)/H(+) antiporter n=1 Tax=Iodobacter fluviatilis TaxID=537 RepID=A0A377SU33_9NEIS|nr:monovalent cation:proton antiporter-2 (CPA2) family protein [Iodobacter fluviatilis]TCU88053.1 Kef-type potassium/proton antiporter (CPA2 family) [Iodobacter fluviatilis]STR45554.1 K(+)/H(+) antiporter [Iodobacter fluviatilis]
MENNQLLHTSVVLLAAAVIAVPIFKRFNLGSILGYLVAGVIVGPYFFGFIKDPAAVLDFAEIGVVLLLFVLGLELNPKSLWQMRKKIIGLGGAQLLLCGLALAGLSVVSLSLEFKTSFLVGVTLALSSTAFAVQLLKERSMLNQPIGRIGFAILLMQDLAVIPVLLSLQAMAPDPSGHIVPWWLGLLAVVITLFIGTYLLSPLLKIVAKYGNSEVMTAAALLIVLGAALGFDYAGLSMAMGAFIAGIMLANSSFRHQLEADIEPFKGLLLGLFFITIGTSINLKMLLADPWFLLAGALLLLMVKSSVIAALIAGTTGQSKLNSFRLGLMLAQGGEFAFVVMAQALSLHILDKQITEEITIVVGLSMALNAPLLMIFERLIQRKGKEKAVDYSNVKFDSNKVIIAGFGRFGQATGRLLSAKGMQFTALDKDPEHIEFLKKVGHKIYFGDATRHDLLRKAGAKQASVLLIAIDNISDSLHLAQMAKRKFPHLRIIARAHNRTHALSLMDLDVDVVIREVWESSLTAAEHTLMALGYSPAHAERMIDIFQRHDEASLLEQLEHKDDMNALIALAKENRQQMSDLFVADRNVYAAEEKKVIE